MYQSSGNPDMYQNNQFSFSSDNFISLQPENVIFKLTIMIIVTFPKKNNNINMIVMIIRCSDNEIKS
jgi:hypothetical protein